LGVMESVEVEAVTVMVLLGMLLEFRERTETA
jgi:hypothetical protein